jgi:hypothetical protein
LGLFIPFSCKGFVEIALIAYGYMAGEVQANSGIYYSGCKANEYGGTVIL